MRALCCYARFVAHLRGLRRRRCMRGDAMMWITGQAMYAYVLATRKCTRANPSSIHCIIAGYLQANSLRLYEKADGLRSAEAEVVGKAMVTPHHSDAPAHASGITTNLRARARTNTRTHPASSQGSTATKLAQALARAPLPRAYTPLPRNTNQTRRKDMATEKVHLADPSLYGRGLAQPASGRSVSLADP